MIAKHLKTFLEPAVSLSKLFTIQGYSLYLVGGSVRDAILMAESNTNGSFFVDLDFTTDAEPTVVKNTVGNWADAIWTQGEAFGTIACLHKGIRYEITTYRKEVYPQSSRKPHVVFGDNIETDLSRRDFTVNAMALSLPDLKLIDPFNGLDDLVAKRLRTPMSPAISFSDDPLRMLRAARFIAKYDLMPDDDLVEAVCRERQRIQIVSAERIRDELNKLIVVTKPTKGLEFILHTKLADEFLPELPALALEQDPIHKHKDVLLHTLAVVERTRPIQNLRLAALFHDMAKPATRSFARGKVTFYQHDVLGAKMARHRMRALRYPTQDIRDVSGLINLHLRFHTYRFGWTDRAVRRYVRDAGPLLEQLNELVRCDCTTRNENKARELGMRMDELDRRIKELRAKEEIDALRPELNGLEIMELLNISPGPQVGKALEFLLELRIEEGILGEKEVKNRLCAWWEEHKSD
ncbi:MAG: CCA tRNA nucleotidyltransferase [Actinobacteria bacterium]|nr:CCA tRNA nucleotidyltransferase [Actinomycetota bacterium]MCL6104271.1 CCA tRNA nucleotidyltransferase [Actinomycetota bacterium]